MTSTTNFDKRRELALGKGPFNNSAALETDALDERRTAKRSKTLNFYKFRWLKARNNVANR